MWTVEGINFKNNDVARDPVQWVGDFHSKLKGGSEEFLCVGMQIKSVNRTICYPRRGQACRVEEKNGWIEIESTNRERKEEGRRLVGFSSFLSILNPSPHFPLVLLTILKHPSIGKVIIIVIISDGKTIRNSTIFQLCHPIDRSFFWQSHHHCQPPCSLVMAKPSEIPACSAEVLQPCHCLSWGAFLRLHVL